MRRVKFSLVMMLSLIMIGFISCKKDGTTVKPILVEDGIYVVGEATNYAELDAAALMSSATNEAASNAARDGMFEIYTVIESGKTFYISEVAGKAETKYGPSAVANEFFSYNPNGKIDQVKVTIQLGKYAAGTTTFTVPESGLYHIVMDKQLGKVAIIPIPYWGIIGAATPGSWSNESQMALDGAFSKTALTFKITDLVMRQGDYKFRHSGGWKVQIDDTSTVAGASTVKVNTNFGGSLSALVAGGANMTLALADEGKYTIQADWTLANGFAFSVTKTGVVDPLPTYPDSMFLVGAATAYGWDAPGTFKNAAMHKIAGGASFEGIFWKICFLTGGQGFKISNKGWGNVNLGFADATYDVDGVTVSDNSGNMSVAADGMYIVVLNLRDNLKKVSIKPAEVYGMDAPFGNAAWTTAFAAAKFTVDNTAKTLVSPALVAAGNIRMYAYHTWLGDWWHAEFRVNGTALEYRNDGGDQAAVAGTVGQVVTLHFDDNTGTIATPPAK
jgi:hypothetical protein